MQSVYSTIGLSYYIFISKGSVVSVISLIQLGSIYILCTVHYDYFYHQRWFWRDFLKLLPSRYLCSTAMESTGQDLLCCPDLLELTGRPKLWLSAASTIILNYCQVGNTGSCQIRKIMQQLLLLRIFRLLTSSLLLWSQHFGWYVLQLSSGVSCQTRESTQNLESNPLF